ncbi:MAG: hypothetical protein IE927_07485 [Rhodobacterales bacterium]|nr:hypothetical protein [Rhodobacterales bacterium]
MTLHSARAARALAHLGEVDPALAVLALWCRHRDGPGPTRTEGEVITYGAAFATLGLPEQVGMVAHHVLHVALRHSARQAALARRLGPDFDPVLFGLAADGIVNETLIVAGLAIPRPAVLLTDLLAEAGLPAQGAVEALAQWDVDRLAMALHRDPDRGRRLRDWGRRRGFEPDLVAGPTPAGRDRGPGRHGLAQPDPAGARGRAQGGRGHRPAGGGAGRPGPRRRPVGGASARPAGAGADRTAAPRLAAARGALAGASGHGAERTGGPAPVFEPGWQRTSHAPRVAIGLDTSSSIDAQTLRLFVAEAEAIARRTAAETWLLAFDEVVFSRQRLDRPGWNRLARGGLRTGGGTDYGDLFRQIGALRPSIAVLLTDLDAPLPPRPAFPVVWAVPRDVADPPYGRVLRMDQAG